MKETTTIFTIASKREYLDIQKSVMIPELKYLLFLNHILLTNKLF